jgi:hypothetical protein
VAETSNTDAPAPSASARDAVPQRRGIFRLLRRVLLYHVILAAALLAVPAGFPTAYDHLPIGGVRELAAIADVPAGQADVAAPAAGTVSADSRPEHVLDRLGYARRLAIALAGVWVLMLPVSWVQKGVHRSSTYDHSLDETTLILPGVVAAIVLVVQYSLALAFALAGIVAGVQFRRALQDTFDALFILVAIGTGIAAGVGALEVAAVMTVFFCYATLYVCRFGDGFESDYVAERKERKRLLKSGHGKHAAGSCEDPP